MNKQEFIKNISKYFSIDNKIINSIETYRILLQEENKKMNLTRLDSDDKFYSEFLYESLISYKDVNFQKNNKILDIGSGSGIPGILLKIFFPFIELTIIEANNKKINFLKELTSKLNIHVILKCKRAEKIDKEEIEKYNFVTSRAVASIGKIVEISSQYVKLNGLLFLPKSINYKTEFKSLNKIEKILGLKLEEIDSFVSINNKTHNVIKFKKIAHTNNNFPRSWDKILKSPF